MFTPQQTGRMLCWIDHLLSGWKSPVLIEADASFGSAPLVVGLSGNSYRQVDSWYWEFGDQSSSTEATPSHLYSSGGLYTVSVEIETPEGSVGAVEADFVWVEADTASIGSVAVVPGEPIRLELAVVNYIPVKEIVLPVSWSAENGLELDSISTVGIRTSEFEISTLLDLDNVNRQAAIHLVSTTSADPIYLDPGRGPVVALYFSTEAGLADTTSVDFAGYGPFSPFFTCAKGFYEPDLIGGALSSASCCQGRVGDANASGDDDPTIGDISSIIDMLFLTGTEVECMPEADINQTGGSNPVADDITIGDVSELVDYLFITGSSLGLPDCL